MEHGLDDYTQDGTVDLKGKPVLRSKRGGLRACSFVVGQARIFINESLSSLPTSPVLVCKYFRTFAVLSLRSFKLGSSLPGG
ncbi:hypothetical protein POTOM_035675 [Populus tomentosa]|uniref:Uncharacterized protein n=1 Tax=Populus tomentosa TaxID=118781 RepID=A0A8X7YTH6_POPTO|nr:hypothetical protein POTOM_035675 [Populus tomentosa]